MDKDELIDKIESSGYKRIEFTKHFYQRARRRNIDADSVKKKLEKHDFVEVRENNQGDPNFEYSYKVTVKTEYGYYEMPVYFNVPGPKILVKSIWPR